jgi:3-hydroxyisobutyrate dehydrogenase-like beta-hydroxyacid dehydrogenase
MGAAMPTVGWIGTGRMVISGPRGLLSGEARPQVVIDSSTVSTEGSARIRDVVEAAGAQFLAAPVSGNPKVIGSGQLTVAASGPREVFDQVEPLLASWGRGVTYVGEGEAARLVKIAHNVFLGVVAESLAEITVLAERGGSAGLRSWSSSTTRCWAPRSAAISPRPWSTWTSIPPSPPPCCARTCSSACQPGRN